MWQRVRSGPVVRVVAAVGGGLGGGGGVLLVAGIHRDVDGMLPRLRVLNAIEP